jgi:hypothetical protein
LHDEEDGLSGANQPGQQDQGQAIGIRAYGPFHLPLEDDNLLAQEGMFGDELGLASAKIGEWRRRQRGPEGFGPTSQARGERIGHYNSVEYIRLMGFLRGMNLLYLVY